MRLSRFLEESGRLLLAHSKPPPKRPFQLITFGEGGVVEGGRLDKVSELLAAEDEERFSYRKMNS